MWFALIGLGLVASGYFIYRREKGGTSVTPAPISNPDSGAGVSSSEPDYSPQADYGIDALMSAMATAEGSLDAHPDWNNPGDLTKSFGFTTVGVGNSEGVLMFDTLNHGWGALRAQLELIRSGNSRVYSASDTIKEMAVKWAGPSGANDWANNVSTALGVSADTTIGNFLV